MISEYFTDDELISQLKMFFNDEEQEHIDFKALLGQITEIDSETFEIKIKNRTFRFSNVFCDVEEVE